MASKQNWCLLFFFSLDPRKIWMRLGSSFWNLFILRWIPALQVLVPKSEKLPSEHELTVLIDLCTVPSYSKYFSYSYFFVRLFPEQGMPWLIWKERKVLMTLTSRDLSMWVVNTLEILRAAELKHVTWAEHRAIRAGVFPLIVTFQVS